MDKVFIDSNFFVALHNPQDSLHQKAIDISKILEEESAQVFLSNYIFLETVTVLSQRANRDEAILRGNQLQDKNSFNLIQVTNLLQDQSWQIFCDTTKKNTSFVDCSTIAIMRAEGIESLLTFDQEDFAPLLKKHHLSLYK